MRVVLELKGPPEECSKLADAAEHMGLIVAHVRTASVLDHFEILTTEELKAMKSDLNRAQRSAAGLRSVTARRRILNHATDYPTSGHCDELVPISTVASLCNRITKLTARNRRLREMNQNLHEELEGVRERLRTLKDANIQRWFSPHPGDGTPATDGKEGMP